jgi:hypothetical protein
MAVQDWISALAVIVSLTSVQHAFEIERSAHYWHQRSTGIAKRADARA